MSSQRKKPQLTAKIRAVLDAAEKLDRGFTADGFWIMDLERGDTVLSLLRYRTIATTCFYSPSKERLRHHNICALRTIFFQFVIRTL